MLRPPTAERSRADGDSAAAVNFLRQKLHTVDSRIWSERGLATGALLGVGIVLLGLSTVTQNRFGLLLLTAAVGLVAVVLGLRSPVLAVTYLLVTTFFRLAVPPGTLPVDPFVLAFGGVIASWWIWRRPSTRGLPALGAIEGAMALYVAWNVMSMIAPHQYPAGPVLNSPGFSVVRFILIGTVMPFTMFLVGRSVFRSERSIRYLLWALLGAASYSAAVSIMQFAGPAAIVWPRYIVEAPNWPERAVGVFNQPVVNGLVLIVGFLVAVLVASHAAERRGIRRVAMVIGAACGYAIYLTHTRAEWLSFTLVVLIGAVAAKGFRRGFVVAGVLLVTGVLATWSTFTSSDRAAGGVGSASEVEDRLNGVATSLWAVGERPFTGWGIGRFPAVNTYHHRSWSVEVPWERGYGISSHFDSLGILVELGFVGLALWVTVLVLIFVALARAVRLLPSEGMYNRPFALTALLSLVALVITGTTVDLRFFDFPNIVVMLLAGSAIGRAADSPGRTGSEGPGLELGLELRETARSALRPAGSGSR